MRKKTQIALNFIHHHHKLLGISIASLFFLILGLITFWVSSFEIPDLKSFETRIVSQSTKIYDRTGEILLFDVNQDIKRQVVPFDQISPYIKKATVSIEDTEFYEHNGIKITSIIRAVLSNLTGGSTQGGSTITQQVIKNSLLTSDRAVSRKLKEWVLAVRLEKIMSKDEILLTYLNESPFGGSIYGVEEASRTFFGKKALDVTVAEAAYLAAIPNAPTYFSPYGKNKDKLDARKNLVLEKMKENKFITESEFNAAKKEVVTFKPRLAVNIKAAHFVDFIKQKLEEEYGEQMIRQGGLKVITTIDYTLQEKAEEIVKKYVIENEDGIGGENGAMVVMDPKTGQILSMVGSRDYFDQKISGNFNVATAKRQPGSTFKPFVYATAFAKGYTPETILFDLPTQFQTTCTVDGKPIGDTNPDDCYMPKNYDDKFLGPMTLRNALAQSRNIPALKLLYLAGIKDSINTARNMGITSLETPDRYGLTLVLGGGEVSLLELTNAYGVFANEGIRNPYTGILKIENSRGEVLAEYSSQAEVAIDEEVANKISDILSDESARAPGFGANSALYIKDRQVAVKTGTTNDNRDAWIVGYTPNLVVGAWMGNNDNSPMIKKTAGLIISPMWRQYMDAVLPSITKESFSPIQPTPTDLKAVFRGVWKGNESFIIDTISNRLATEMTPEETRKEIYIPEVHEILHWVDKNDPLGDPPKNPAKDPQYKLWEHGVQNWLATQYIEYPDRPTEYDDVHTEAKSPRIRIVDPLESKKYNADDKITVQTENKGPYLLSKVDFYLNDNYIGSSSKAPYLLSFTPSQTVGLKEKNTLKVVATDVIYNRGQSEITLTIED